jgi:hypothetical protein
MAPNACQQTTTSVSIDSTPLADAAVCLLAGDCRPDVDHYRKDELMNRNPALSGAS